MRHVVYLALRYVAYHRWKTVLLVVAITLTVALPLALDRVIRHYEERLRARAVDTPLLVGARGSRFDLALHALYFRGKVPGTLRMAESEAIGDSGLAVPTPLHVRATARGYPVVGTTLEYFERRGLLLREGTLPRILGDCVIGREVAEALGIGAGDRIVTDPENPFDLAGAYPLRMRVTGVLARAGSPDDAAVFADLRTAWIIDGLGHGHQDLAKGGDEDVVLERTEDRVVANAALEEYTEIDASNIDSFHFHGDPEDFPITAVVAWPEDDRAATLLRGRYLDPDASVQALVPAEVVDELFGMVFRIKRLFDTQVGLVGLSTGLFLVLVVLLSFRLRMEERRTMHKLGCSRRTVVGLHAVELLLVLAMAAALAGGLAAIAVWQAPRILEMLLR